MFFKRKELELRKVEFNEIIPAHAIDLGTEIELKAPLRSAGRAELVRETRGAREIVEDIRLVGSFSTQVQIRCARCLEPVTDAVTESFDLLYRPLGVDARGEESSITRDETEIGYYQGEGLLLEDVLKEQILLALPAREICSAECRGLCPQCGCNLNVESCDCVTSVPDARWSALEELRKKLER